jgi:predicted glycoside hydrolase/deacetylase ChbG (UPF0249 family)
MSERKVIVNADDFGRSPGINGGVVEAFERGVVTSASLMVRWPAALEAAACARAHPRLSVGLHLDFAEWEYRAEQWAPVYQVVDTNDARALISEIGRQLDRFEQLMGQPPTHIDSHQHAHLREPARACVLEATRHLKVPVRGLTSGVEYCGSFYGQDENGLPCPDNIRIARLCRIFSGFQAGVTELGCHPAAQADLDTVYGSERITDLQTLCDSRVRRALEQQRVKLISFLDWRAHAA